jgi:radical SAM superfamily enzyme YgiQ (UPF0313 family)
VKVIFSNPPWWAHSPDGLRRGIRAGSRWPFTRAAEYPPDQRVFGGYYPFPFFLGFAASYAQEALPGVEIELRDSITRGESYESYLEHLRAMQPDYLVIESATTSLPHDMQLIRVIKDFLPKLRVVLTGPGNDKVPDGVHAVVQGEYEQGVLRVLDGESGLIAHDLLDLDDMNAAPVPMVDESAAAYYWDGCPQGQIAPQLQIWASRGCPYKCCFCVWPATMTGNDPDGSRARRPRFYSGEYVEHWISSYRARHKVASVYFDDDTFNLSDKHTLEICEVMRRVKLPWSAMCRADTSAPEVWREMKHSGCFGVKIGFESGVQRVIDQIVNKRLDLKKAEATAHFLHEIGMTVHGTFTVGLPGETVAESKQTVGFISRLLQEGAIDTYQLSGTAEISGTPLANMRQGEALKAYPGAVKDSGYTASADGQKKIEAFTP